MEPDFDGTLVDAASGTSADAGSEHPTPDEPTPAPSGRSFFARHGLSTLDVLMLFGIVIITCGYLPFFATSLWTPRMLVLLIALPPGLVALASLAFKRSIAARFALGVIAWSIVAAVFSESFAGALLGFLGQQLSALTVAASFGLWALARHMSPNGRRLAIPVTLTCLLINAAVGLIQVVFELETTDLSLVGGRATGLSTGSIQFAAFMATGVLLCVQLVPARRSPKAAAWIAAAFVFGLLTALAGSRVAVAVVVLLGVAAVVMARHVMSAAAFGAALIGVLASRFFSAGDAATSRLTSTEGSGRSRWWRHSVDAVLERPLTGWGFGRFRDVEQGALTFDEARKLASNFEQHMDPHNFVLAIAVAIGIPGLLLAAGFAWRVLSGARGPFVLMALGIAVTWLLQPMALTTLPFVMIFLGMAHRTPTADAATVIDDATTDDATAGTVSTSATGVRRAVAPSSLPGRAVIVATLVGLFMAGWLGVAEVRLKVAYDNLDPFAGEAAARMYPGDPIANNFAASLWTAEAKLIDPTLTDRATASLERSIELEPNRALWWVELARFQGFNGDIEGARASTLQALELQPTYEQAWSVLLIVAQETNDDELRAEASAQLCRLDVPDTCS